MVSDSRDHPQFRRLDLGSDQTWLLCTWGCIKNSLVSLHKNNGLQLLSITNSMLKQFSIEKNSALQVIYKKMC